MLFAVLPFLFSLIIIFVTPNRGNFHWYLLWPRGELLLVSIGFAADGVGEALDIKEKSLDVYRLILVVICFLVTSIASFGYALMQLPNLNFTPATITISSMAFFV